MKIVHDCVVIGGGVVGLSVAYGLLKAGRTVAVLDGEDTDARASRANFGKVSVQSKGLGMPDYAKITRQSSDLWPDFAADLEEITGIDIGYQVTGGFSLALSENALQVRRDFIARLNAQQDMEPVPTTFLDRADLLAINGEFGPDVLGASYCPLDAEVNVLRLLFALHGALRRRGGHYHPHCTVTGIRQDGANIAIVSGNQVFLARQVVIAAGLGSENLARDIGISARIHPDPATILVTEKTEPLLKHSLGSIRQTDEGSILIGGSPAFAGHDMAVRMNIMVAMARRAVRIFPRLQQVRIVRAWTGLRVMTEDGFPLYKQSAVMPGAFVCVCHSGVTLAAFHHAVLAPMIARGAIDSPLRGFSSGRYVH